VDRKRYGAAEEGGDASGSPFIPRGCFLSWVWFWFWLIRISSIFRVAKVIDDNQTDTWVAAKALRRERISRSSSATASAWHKPNNAKGNLVRHTEPMVQMLSTTFRTLQSKSPCKFPTLPIIPQPDQPLATCSLDMAAMASPCIPRSTATSPRCARRDCHASPKPQAQKQQTASSKQQAASKPCERTAGEGNVCSTPQRQRQTRRLLRGVSPSRPLTPHLPRQSQRRAPPLGPPRTPPPRPPPSPWIATPTTPYASAAPAPKQRKPSSRHESKSKR